MTLKHLGCNSRPLLHLCPVDLLHVQVLSQEACSPARPEVLPDWINRLSCGHAHSEPDISEEDFYPSTGLFLPRQMVGFCFVGGSVFSKGL